MLDFQNMFSDLFELDDPLDKYEWIIDYGAGTVGLDKQYHNDNNLVKGCNSSLWLAKEETGRIAAWAESSIINGIASMICAWYNQASTTQQQDFSLNTLTNIGLAPLLSAGRQNGVASLITKIKTL
jgi:cysteine desulfuration protein SufE